MSRPMKPQTIFTLLAGILIVSVGIAIAIATDNDKAGLICFEEPSWTNPHPGAGTQVDHYVAEVFLVDTGDTLKFPEIPYNEPKSSFRYEAPCGQTHQMRVAGVDADGRQGPWSNWSYKQVFEQEIPGYPNGD